VLLDEPRLAEVLQWLMGAGAEVRAVTPQRATLEELFMATAAEVGAVGAVGADTRRSA
jgi:hypothetical protein